MVGCAVVRYSVIITLGRFLRTRRHQGISRIAAVTGVRSRGDSAFDVNQDWRRSREWRSLDVLVALGFIPPIHRPQSLEHVAKVIRVVCRAQLQLRVENMRYSCCSPAGVACLRMRSRPTCWRWQSSARSRSDWYRVCACSWKLTRWHHSLLPLDGFSAERKCATSSSK